MCVCQNLKGSKYETIGISKLIKLLVWRNGNALKKFIIPNILYQKVFSCFPPVSRIEKCCFIKKISVQKDQHKKAKYLDDMINFTYGFHKNEKANLWRFTLTKSSKLIPHENCPAKIKKIMFSVIYTVIKKNQFRFSRNFLSWQRHLYV